MKVFSLLSSKQKPAQNINHNFILSGGKVTIASAIHWHLCKRSSVVYIKYTPSSLEQISSMADRLSVNLYYGTSSNKLTISHTQRASHPGGSLFFQPHDALGKNGTSLSSGAKEQQCNNYLYQTRNSVGTLHGASCRITR